MDHKLAAVDPDTTDDDLLHGGGYRRTGRGPFSHVLFGLGISATLGVKAPVS